MLRMVKSKSLNEQLEGMYFYAWNPYLDDRTLYVFKKGKGYSLITPHIFKLSLKDKKKLLKEKFKDYTQERFESEFKDRIKNNDYVIVITKDDTNIFADKYKFNYFNNRLCLYINGNYIASLKLEKISKIE